MRYLLYFLAGVLALCLIILGWQHFEIGHLDTEVATAQAQVALLTEENRAFSTQVQVQNAAIDEWKAKAKKEHDAAQAAMVKAQANAAQYAAASQALDEVKPTGNECKDAFAYIDSYFRGLK